MSNAAIQVRGLAKRYRLGEIGSSFAIGSLRETITSFWNKRDSDVTPEIDGEFIWALDDLNFDISKGERIGIIGKNGSGKSTLLKILAGITPPTRGEVKINGRVSALLEVGTGFHAELTGRENVFLNGAILGLTRAEILRKFDEIVDFSGVERYIDTPVKRYSSGMVVRLAFAVAAYLQSDILLVDEVLAVGDAEFRRKCLGRMESASASGRTVIFVSHNMTMINQLCERGIYLESGRAIKIGPVSSVVESYMASSSSNEEEISYPELKDKDVQVSTIYIRNAKGQKSISINRDEAFELVIETLAWRSARGTINIALRGADGTQIVHSIGADSLMSYTDFEKDKRHRFIVKFPGGILSDSTYYFIAWIVPPGDVGSFHFSESPRFTLYDLSETEKVSTGIKTHPSIIKLNLDWASQDISKQ